MRDRHIEGALGFGDVVHAVAQAAVGETVLAHIEPVALAAEQIVGWHFQVLDLDLGMAAVDRVGVRALDRHVLDVALDLVARVRQLHDEGRILLVTRRVRIGLGHHQRHVGDAGGGGEPLLAVENVILVAILHGGGLHAGGVGARRFFRHRKADALVAIEQRLEEFFLLIFGAVLEDGHHRGVVGTLRVHGERAEHALAELHLHQRVGERAEAHAAILLRHERAPQPLRPRLLPQLPQHFVERLGVQLLFRGNAFVMDPLADFLADRLGLGRNFEIDRHRRFPRSGS